MFTPKPKVKKVAERDVEAEHKAEVARKGGEAHKWVSPGFTGVPDQIDFYGVDRMVAILNERLGPVPNRGWHEFATELLAAAIQFTELKAPKGKPKAHQERRHKELRDRGFTVNVKDHL